MDVVRDRGPRDVLVTSVLTRTSPRLLDVVAVSDAGAWALTTPLLPISPNGGGDVTAALYLAHLRTYGLPRHRARRDRVVGLRRPRGDPRAGTREIQSSPPRTRSPTRPLSFEVRQLR